MPELNNKKEWIGTKIIWEILQNADTTTLLLTHQGLNSAIKCFEVCLDGWNSFLNSIDMLLTTGKGLPFLNKKKVIA